MNDFYDYLDEWSANLNNMLNDDSILLLKALRLIMTKKTMMLGLKVMLVQMTKTPIRQVD